MPAYMVTVSQQEISRLSGGMVTVSQEETARLAGCMVAVKQIERNPQHRYFFDNKTLPEPFDILIYIGGELIEFCRLVGQLRITKAVNVAHTAELTIDAPVGELDLYQYAGKQIEIFYSSATKYIKVYRGMVATQKVDIYQKTLALVCTDEKINKIANLSTAEIEQIGYFEKALFDEKLNNVDEFGKRMDSIPFDYYFNESGELILTAWQPEQVADFTIQNCRITNDSLAFSVLNLGQITNKINLLFQFQYNRKIQRDLLMSYDNGLSGTRISEFYQFVQTYHMVPCPQVNAVISAANGAGWVVGDFRYSGLPPAAEYHGWHWSPSKYADNFAMSASWKASKRWVQSVQEDFKITLKNDSSIAFFDEKAEDLNFALKLPLDEDDTWGQNYQCYFAPQGTQASNGDWIIDLSQSARQTYLDAFNYALNVARTKIFYSHCQNEIAFDYYVKPDATLSDTISVNTPYFQGNVKVCEITHIFDKEQITADTKFRAKWFKGFDGDDLVIPARPQVPVSSGFTGQVSFGNHITRTYSAGTQPSMVIGSSVKPDDYCIAKDGYDNLYGYVMNEFIANQIVAATVGKMSPVKFAVKTPDIEKEMTDGLTVEVENELNIAIPNSTIRTFIPIEQG